jgi:phosphate starvation-inducible PhoH-like protein|tara:strand:+ start:3510 stop:4691 length:1182 start_codon:yes stop_codon:yes gene_type:complete
LSDEPSWEQARESGADGAGKQHSEQDSEQKNREMDGQYWPPDSGAGQPGYAEAEYAEPDKVVALTTSVTLEPNDNRRLAALCGPFDQNLKHLEKRLGVHIRSRGNQFQVSGTEQRIRAASALLSQLYVETRERETIEPDLVHLYLQESGVDALLARTQEPEASSADDLVVRTPRKTIKTRGANQRAYTSAIRDSDVNFGIGPAGTGKTYLAVACAVEALESQRVARILLVRPAVEAGEKLGFLPGDLAQKIDPYLRPLYDALYEMMGVERVNKAIERNIIEVAPLAYMRGRTLNNAFIILDESQNTTVEQMKMFLTRIGFGSTAVITGDITQIDLPRGQKSGLVNVRGVLRAMEGISFMHFSSKDVVRHPLVQKIVDAYAQYQEPDASDRDAG